VQFYWDASTQRYRDASGRFVSRARVRQAIDRAIDVAQAEIRTLSRQLANGSRSIDSWYFEMRGLVKDVNLMSAAAARGGFAQMTAADYGRVGAQVKQQYAYLDRFVGQIAAGGMKLGPGFLNRAASYANAGRGFYHKIVGGAMKDVGYDLERNQLGPVEVGHCEGPDSCLAETARGWVQIGTLVPIGERLCRGACKCSIAYGKSSEIEADE
jgi:hypothetical protein